MIEILILVVHVLVAAGVCLLVLLQHGKGADMGAAFGGGASGSLFGSSGSANFLSRTTAVLAAVFFATSLGLTWYAAQAPRVGSVMEDAPEQQAPATPTQAPAPPATAPAPAGTGSVPQPEGAAENGSSNAPR
jgi:preprotein translocase subunit SecG